MGVSDGATLIASTWLLGKVVAKNSAAFRASPWSNHKHVVSLSDIHTLASLSVAMNVFSDSPVLTERLTSCFKASWMAGG